MDVKVMVHCPDISKEELLHMLQAVRTAEQTHFKEKTLAIFLETNPEISVEEAQDLLGRIKPPFAINTTTDKLKEKHNHDHTP